MLIQINTYLNPEICKSNEIGQLGYSLDFHVSYYIYIYISLLNTMNRLTYTIKWQFNLIELLVFVL